MDKENAALITYQENKLMLKGWELQANLYEIDLVTKTLKETETLKMEVKKNTGI